MKKRRQFTIKQRITLWYTVFMTALVAAVIALLLFLSGSRIQSEAYLRLQDAVERSFNEVEYDDGALRFDDDINYMADGVTITVYDAHGVLVFGRIPARFDGAPLLIKNEMQTVTSQEGVRWYVYDTCQTIQGYGTLWIRGVTSPADADTGLSGAVTIALIALPFFVLIALVGGYLITRRTLRPLDTVTDTAQRISTGADLSARIHLSGGNDEVHRLAHTFDGMMDRLQAAFESEKQFTSDVSHELRTPVSVILTQCEYAAHPQTTPEEMRTSLSVVASQAHKMSALISQLLMLARTESGRQALNFEEIDLSMLTEAVCLEQEAAAGRRSISIVSDLQPDVMLRADETLLMRLLINLVSNAIAYGRENGHVWVTLRASPHTVTCTVRDDGIGIAPEHLDKIWNRFYQVDPARSHNRTGAGLGLPMVRWIARAHGGDVTAESTPGKGSAFTLTLPRKLPVQ